MKQLFPRGKRIRPTDKDLVFHTALAALFPIFLLDMRKKLLEKKDFWKK